MKCKICEIVQQVRYLNEKQIKIAVSRDCIVKYAYILHDKDVNEDGTLKEPHWHIVLQFTDTQDSKFICKWFGVEEQYVGKSKSGRFQSMLAYLIHANAKGKFQYPVSNVTANFDYEKALTAIKGQQRLEDILAKIKEGTIREFNYTRYISPEEYVKYRDKIKAAYEYRRDSLYSGSRSLEVIFIQGCSGSGKTTYAKHLAEELHYSFYISSSDNDILDGYKGQDCLILDDLRGSSIKLNDLLKLLDNNTDSLARSRYHNKSLSECKLIIITTVVPLEDFYKSVFESSNEPIEQFKRRITTQIIMDKSYLLIGQYNKQTQDYDFGNQFYENPLPDILKNKEEEKPKIIEHLKKSLPIIEDEDFVPF